ncbi:MAG: ATP synthase F1 subunit delta, partial [Myxococcales bacterium]
PVLTGEEKVKLVEAILAQLQLDATVANGLRLLAQRNRLADLPEVVAEYDTLADKHIGRVRAKVVTAIQIPDEQIQQIAQSLSGATSKKVVVERKVDPAILGGVVAQIGSTVYDGSIKTQLEDMRKQLKSAGL